MKKIAALVSIFAIAVTGSAFAIDSPSGNYTVTTDALDAFDCEGVIKWEQLPNGVSGLSSQDDQCYPFLSEVADDFMGDGEMMIGAGWWGVYWNGTPIAPDAFNLKVYADGGGAPGELIYSEAVTDYNETFGDPYGYCALLSEGVMKMDGMTYWLGVQAVFCFPPQWGYGTGEGSGSEIHFLSAFFGYPDWVPGSVVFGVPYDAAFLLYNGGEVPTEDATWSEIKALY